jgi:transcriptional regulator with XRE-family HTH domain
MAKKPATWTERFLWALEQRSMKPGTLARVCKISRASMTEWTNGQTKNPRLDNFFAACDELGIRPRWLALGDPPIEPQSDDAPPPFSERVMRIAEMLERRPVSAQQTVLDLLRQIPERAEQERPTDAENRQVV